MRDKDKTEEYFLQFLQTRIDAINFNVQSIQSGKMSERKIERAYFRNIDFRIQSLIAQYSLGNSLREIKNYFKGIINELYKYWYSDCAKISVVEGKKLNQYMVSPYERFLHVLSLAFLLNVDDKDFQILVDIIDRDDISDNLYEFIIKARFPNRVQKRSEEYDTEHSVILKVYNRLRKATKEKDKVAAARLVKQFLEKDYYHKHMNLYNSHNSKANIYCGYWSFEAAAVVKIMGLDDSSFIDNQYYPKDLVHQLPLTKEKKGWLGKLGF